MNLPKSNFRLPPQPKLQTSGFSSVGGGSSTPTYKSVNSSDFTSNSGSYSTLNVSGGSSMSIEFGGGFANTTNIREAGFLSFDTGIRLTPNPLNDNGKGYYINSLLDLDITSLSAGDDLNIGMFIFDDTPNSLSSDGGGYYGGGTVSRTGETNGSMVLFTPNRKSGSALADRVVGAVTQVTPANILQLSFTQSFVYRAYNGGSAFNTPYVTDKFAIYSYKSSSGWFGEDGYNSSAFGGGGFNANGSTIHVGIWMSRNNAVIQPTVSFTASFKFIGIEIV
jgi:hypothetical protein